MSNKKQSSIDWLVGEIDNMISFIDIETSINFKKIVEQAKAMHKDEIVNALLQPINGYQEQNIASIFDIKRAEQYYNETFGDEKEVL